MLPPLRDAPGCEGNKEEKMGYTPDIDGLALISEGETLNFEVFFWRTR